MTMKAYHFREDGVFDAEIEIDGPIMPPMHTSEAPPKKDGFYAVMTPRGWELVAGEAPAPIDNSYWQALDAFKADRAARLAATDWWAIRASEPGGVPMTEGQLAYRQALRVMDDAEDFDPFNPQWPAEPGA